MIKGVTISGLGKVLFIGSIICLLGLSACKTDDEPRTGNDKINDWIYANMDYYYYWTSELPEKVATDRDPEVFFKSLLSEKDRFSFIRADYQKLLDQLSGINLEGGFEFKLYRTEEGSDDLFIQISYIKKGSPADLVGLKRGDLIDEINGNQITISNYETLLSELNQPFEVTYRRYNPDSEDFENQGTVDIIPEEVAENPILLDTIYEIEGKKIGYFIYTFFSTGPEQGDNRYDDEMDAVFSMFKSNGVQDVIVDLRYNNGGSEVSALNLASLLVNASSDDLMFRKFYNAEVEEFILNDPGFGEDFLRVNFDEKSENVGKQLATNTVHFITSDRTASASEMVMNSLRPYMEVFMVGDTTVGKDVGSISIFDREDPSNDYALQPIIVRLLNSNNEGYPEGFVPDVHLRDNFLVLKPHGDVEEPLLMNALSAIGVQTGRKIPEATFRSPLLNSVDRKSHSNKLLMKDEFLR